MPAPYSSSPGCCCPPWLIPLLIAIPHLVEWIKERWTHSAHLRAWYLQPFNIAMYSIAALGAHGVYTVLQARLVHGLPLVPMIVVALAVLTYLILNYILLGLALVLARGVSWRASGVLDPETLLGDLILLCLGAVVAALWQVSPSLIVLALAPLVLMYRALLIPQLKQQAQTDAKTGLANARHFTALGTEEVERAGRFNRPLAVIMADLDHFKRINDTYGHLAGDTVLQGLGTIIRTSMRQYDLAGRFGGEEFALALPETGPAEALALAERLRQAVEAARLEVPSTPTPVQVTLSLGVACFPADATTLPELLHAADVAVYQAKLGGRNRVVGAAGVPRVITREAAATVDSPEVGAAVAGRPPRTRRATRHDVLARQA